MNLNKPGPVWIACCLVAAALAGCTRGPAHFETAEAAAAAFVAALKHQDREALRDVLGSESARLIHSGDDVADQEEREQFLARYEQASALIEANQESALLRVGNDGWTLPIPIVKTQQGWAFDAARGEEEIVARRIGRNELAAILVCLAYVDAQYEYARSPVQLHSTREYAQQFMSTKGKRDGLYWPAPPDGPQSPMGPLVAYAQHEGYAVTSTKQAPAYHGYHYRILKAQGSNAPDGAYDYVVDGRMIGGFALIAYPAEYGSSGIKTFLVNHGGVVSEKDLGPGTRTQVERIERYDPDNSWQPVAQEAIELTEAL